MEMLQNFKWINNSPQIPLKIRGSAEPQKKKFRSRPITYMLCVFKFQGVSVSSESYVQLCRKKS